MLVTPLDAQKTWQGCNKDCQTDSSPKAYNLWVVDRWILSSSDEPLVTLVELVEPYLFQWATGDSKRLPIRAEAHRAMPELRNSETVSMSSSRVRNVSRHSDACYHGVDPLADPIWTSQKTSSYAPVNLDAINLPNLIFENVWRYGRYHVRVIRYTCTTTTTYSAPVLTCPDFSQ